MFGLCQAGSREEAVWAQWTALGISELLPGIRFGCDHLFPGTCERTREELCPVLGLIREVSAQPLLSSFCRQLPVLPQVSGVPWLHTGEQEDWRVWLSFGNRRGIFCPCHYTTSVLQLEWELRTKKKSCSCILDYTRTVYSRKSQPVQTMLSYTG